MPVTRTEPKERTQRGGAGGDSFAAVGVTATVAIPSTNVTDTRLSN